MRKVPKIGQRVGFSGRPNCGPFTGTVHAIYPNYDYEYDAEDEPILGSEKVRPESEWQVGVTVDAVPTPWPYPGTNKIAPTVAELKAIR